MNFLKILKKICATIIITIQSPLKNQLTLDQKRDVTHGGPQMTLIQKREVTHGGPNWAFRCLDMIPWCSKRSLLHCEGVENGFFSTAENYSVSSSIFSWLIQDPRSDPCWSKIRDHPLMLIMIIIIIIFLKSSQKIKQETVFV